MSLVSTITVDTTAPANTTTLALVADTGESPSDSATSNPALGGTVSGATAGLGVTILEGATVVGTAAVGAGGAWTFANASAANGAHTYTAVVTDAAGNRGPASAALPVTLDASTPAAPTITGVTDDAGAATGALPSGATTDDNTLTLAGTAEAGATVNVYNGATLVGTATANGSGAWGLTTAALPDGAASLTARATNVSGTQGPASAAFTATVDTTAPAAPTIDTVSDNAGAITGALSSGGATDDTTLALAGTAEAGATVNVYNGATLVGTATANGSGAWSLTTAALPEGAASLTARATDASGNTSGTSAAFTATVDTTAPAVASVSASGTGITNGSGSLDAGKTVTLTLNAGEALLVAGTPTLALNNGATATYAGGSGTAALSFTYTVAAGQDTADLAVSALNLPSGASIRDAAGNAATFNAGAVGDPAGTLAIDTNAPGAPAIASVTDDQAPQTGDVAAGGATNDATPVVRVSLADADAAAGDSVQVLANGASAGSATLTAADIAAGFVDIAATLSGGDGAKSLTATITDPSGNSSAASAAVSVTLDTEAPTATPTIRLASDTGTAGDGITTDPALTGTVSTAEAGLAVTVLEGTTVVGTATTGPNGVWTLGNGAAADGAHTYTAIVVDSAGNRGAASSPLAVEFDRTGDTGVVVDLTDARILSPSGASVDLDLLGLDAGSTASVTFTGSAGGSVTRTFTSGGPQAADVSGLEGDVTAGLVQVTDAAGNVTAGQGETLAADPVCFMPGTLVETPSGERAVETLRAGDLVLTAEGRAAPIRWLGRQTVSTRFADPLRVLPVRVAAGALGENLPRRDLLLSPDHALLVDGVLAQAGALVNGSTVRREAEVPEVFTYWHVELADHALVLAEGVPAESFIDNVSRLGFDNWDEHEQAGSEAPIAEMPLPRAKSHRQVPQATRRRLAERAALLTAADTAAA